MATVPIVVAVRRNASGDVIEVQWGVVDTDRNAWHGDGPTEAPVIDVVDALMARDTVWSRLPSGAPGPKLKVVPARVGQGVESIELDHAQLTIADLIQF